VAKAKGLNDEQKEKLTDLVKQNIQSSQWHIFGSPRVNVLLLNLALDSSFPPALSTGGGP
jgi:K+-transporting ATPase c subunit